MPFSVTDVSLQFMNMMKYPLGLPLYQFLQLFLNDVLIYFPKPKAHAEHEGKVLGKLGEQSLYAKASKYEIMKTSVKSVSK